MKTRNSMHWIIVASFFSGIAVAATLQRVSGLFFYNVFLGVIASAATSQVLARTSKSKYKVEKSLRPYLLLISSLLTYSFLSTIPLNVDRSYSVWLLKNVADAESLQVTKDRATLINDSVVFFGPSNGQLDRRINEQQRIGNISLSKKGEIELTSRGKLIVKFNSFVGILFGLDPKYSKV